MELVPALESKTETPPLTAARLRRQLTVQRAARIARLTPEEITWLEDGRLYRFPSSNSALLALLLYTTALGIGRREARRLAGLPVLPRRKLTDRVSKTAAAVAAAAVLVVVLGALVLPGLGDGSGAKASSGADAGLPPTWRISVDVLNGSGDMNYTRTVASKIGGMAYRIERVARADRFDYPSTAVYFHNGGRDVAERLAHDLKVQAKPLPGGTDPYRLVVVVGPARL
jgi:LytR cell envelope-related transcriptional attenuator